MIKPEYSIIKLLQTASFTDKQKPGVFVSSKYPYEIKLVAKSKLSKHPGRYTKIVILEPSMERKATNRTHIATFDIPIKYREAQAVLKLVAGIDIK